MYFHVLAEAFICSQRSQMSLMAVWPACVAIVEIRRTSSTKRPLMAVR